MYVCIPLGFVDLFSKNLPLETRLECGDVFFSKYKKE